MNIILLKKIGVLVVISLVYILVCKKIYYQLENKSEIFYKNIKLEKKTKVYDIIHHNLPSLRSLTLLSDIFPYILLTIIFFIDFNLFYNVIGFLVSIYFFRLFIINLTILPKDKKCDIKNTSTYNGGCYDKVYSGHFASSLLCLLLLYNSKYINLFTFLFLSIIIGLLLTTTRSHYTIDIFVALLMVIIVYQNNINFCRLLDKFVK